MNNFGEIKIEKGIPERTSKEGRVDEQAPEKEHLTKSVNVLKKGIVGLQGNLAKLWKWHNDRSGKSGKGEDAGGKSESGSLDNPDRRVFLKNTGKAALGVAAGGGVLGAIGEFSKKYGDGKVDYGVGLSDWEMGQGFGKSKKTLKQEAEAEDWRDEQKYLKALKDNEEKVRGETKEALRRIIESDTRTISELFLAQNKENGKIEINKDVDTVIENSWYKQYSKGEKLHSSLTSALEIMRPWYPAIKDQFIEIAKREGINMPLELVYLAIPESHCRVDRPSPAGAHGWYQLTGIAVRELNRVANLRGDKEKFIVNSSFDERYDPMKCARMAAKLLCLWYKEFKVDFNSEEDTWDLTLARYNGAYVNDFKKEVDGKSDKHAGCRQDSVTYEGYLEYRECRVNTFIAEVKKNGYYIDQDKGGLKVKVELEDDDMGGKKITKEGLKVLLDGYLSDSVENSNYPPKLRGVLRVMEEESLMLDGENLTEYPDKIEGYHNRSLEYISKKEGWPLFALKIANPHVLKSSVAIPASINVYRPAVINIKADKMKMKNIRVEKRKVKR